MQKAVCAASHSTIASCFLQCALCPANGFLDKDLCVEVLLSLQLSVVKLFLHPAARCCSPFSSRGPIPFGTHGITACVVAHMSSFVKMV